MTDMKPLYELIAEAEAKLMQYSAEADAIIAGTRKATERIEQIPQSAEFQSNLRKISEIKITV